MQLYSQQNEDIDPCILFQVTVRVRYLPAFFWNFVQQLLFV